MIDRETLKAWVGPPAGADRYLRPFVARGPLGRRGAAVVGLNPATAIRPGDIPRDEYVDLLLDLEAFTKFYGDLRVRAGKRRTSPTRTGLNGMARWLEKRGWRSVIDTNVSPYPTARGEELDGVSPSLQSRHIFHELITALAPRLLVLHGEDALEEFTGTIARCLAPRAGQNFTHLADHSPHLGQHVWEGGEECDVFVCRHLRFFGHNGGQRFSALEQSLTVRFPDA